MRAHAPVMLNKKQSPLLRTTVERTSTTPIKKEMSKFTPERLTPPALQRVAEGESERDSEREREREREREKGQHLDIASGAHFCSDEHRRGRSQSDNFRS